MDPGDQTITFNEFLTWKVESLRFFLTERGLTKDGTKQELAALCFAAHSMNMPVVPSFSQILEQNKHDYNNLLNVDGVIISDPRSIFDNWLDEKIGVRRWPPIYLSDIINYMMINTDSQGNIQSRLNDYKIGKAYEYYRAGYLGQVYYHDVQGRADLCILKSTCIPSLKVKEDPHQVWVVCNKEGVIKSAYCTCTAGLGSTCNHIAGLLFRVEAANKLGQTACTSVSCEWNTPSAPMNTIVDACPERLVDVNVKKSRHGKLAKRPLVNQSKNTYQPCEDIDKSEMLKELASALKDDLPNACLFKGIECDKESEIPELKSFTDPKNLDVQRYTMASITNGTENVEELLQKMPVYTKQEVDHISAVTVGQWTNQLWHDMRKDRITSSKFHAIVTKVNTLLTKENTNCEYLVSNVLGYCTPNPYIRAIKHGRETEPEAKEIYKRVIKSSGHTAIQVEECGLFIHASFPYLGSSPDLLVSCECCGQGVVEIKCPLIDRCQTCTDFCSCKLPAFLQRDNGNISLKHNHAYYAQIQGQLALSNRHYCDFFVYTCNGYFIQRLNFDSSYFSKILKNLIYFFEHIIAPEIINGTLKNNQVCNLQAESETQTVNIKLQTTYFCPMCHNVVKEVENVKMFSDQSLSCDVCNFWFHFKCVKMNKSKVVKIVNWTCPQCTQKTN